MMAAQTPNTQQTTSEKDLVYDASIHSLAKFQPFTSDNAKKNKKIAFLLHFPLSEEKTRSTVDVIRSEWGCEECGKRVRKMFFFIDADGKGILEPDADDVILTSEQEKMVTEVKKFVHECKRENPKVEDEKGWKWLPARCMAECVGRPERRRRTTGTQKDSGDDESPNQGQRRIRALLHEPKRGNNRRCRHTSYEQGLP